MQKQQAVREAKAAREEYDARPAEIQRHHRDGRRQQTEEKRRAILDDILLIRRLRTRPNALLQSLPAGLCRHRNRGTRACADPAIRRPQGPPRRSRTPSRPRRTNSIPTTPRRAPSPVGHGSAKARSTTCSQKETPANGTQAPQAVEAEAQGQEQAPVARSPEVEQAIAKHDALIPAWKTARRRRHPMQCVRWCRRSRRRGLA